MVSAQARMAHTQEASVLPDTDRDVFRASRLLNRGRSRRPQGNRSDGVPHCDHLPMHPPPAGHGCAWEGVVDRRPACAL